MEYYITLYYYNNNMNNVYIINIQYRIHPIYIIQYTPI